MQLRKSPTALFKAINEERWGKVETMINLYSYQVKTYEIIIDEDRKKPSRRLALHQAVASKAPVHVIKSLISAFPKAAQIKDSLYNRLPIHFACLNGASYEVIQALLEAYPEGAGSTAMYGRLPIHYATASCASIEVIKLLVCYFPECARVKDLHGWLPIHLACLQNADSKVVEILLEIYPESVLVRTKKGNLPLNCLAPVSDSTNKENITALLEDTKSSLTKYDNFSIISPYTFDDQKEKHTYPAIISVESGEFC